MMTNNIYQPLVLEVHFIGIEEIQLAYRDNIPSNDKMVLMYFCREPDSTEIPLSLSEGQAKQLYGDLKKLFSEETT